MGILQIRKLADREAGPNENGSFPFAGVAVIGDPPQTTRMTQKYAMQARDEGWLTIEGMNVVYRPSAPRENPTLSPPHQFVQADAIVIHTVDGDVRYRVVHQPDKYADNGEVDAQGYETTPSKHDDKTKVTDDLYDAGQTRVDYFYGLELEG